MKSDVSNEEKKTLKLLEATIAEISRKPSVTSVFASMLAAVVLPASVFLVWIDHEIDDLLVSSDYVVQQFEVVAAQVAEFETLVEAIKDDAQSIENAEMLIRIETLEAKMQEVGGFAEITNREVLDILDLNKRTELLDEKIELYKQDINEDIGLHFSITAATSIVLIVTIMASVLQNFGRSRRTDALLRKLEETI